MKKKPLICYLFTVFDKKNSLKNFIKNYKRYKSGYSHDLLICYKLINEKHIIKLEKELHGIKHIKFLDTFNEEMLLNEIDNANYFDFQGSTWAPHLIHKEMWEKVGGFSEEFNPGFASDPDLNMKLWREGVRIFKNLNKSRVYHFGSITTRKGNKINRNPGKKKFLKKWGITVEMFTRCYLNRGELYDGPLNEPIKNIKYYHEYFVSLFKRIIIKFTSNNL